eukprot:CAMPEP_0183452572 /NCGR_PEP_ID=MMETSP0370-20130417/118441_1 /TAXON_ID=268820 /ORGANISM="Peridinium aciculiferum, Strain PAER-2" /LENGTH=40 /DNA_ID= /DNA_START= /DNA_END= /DNA_ORIENTATION=
MASKSLTPKFAKVSWKAAIRCPLRYLFQSTASTLCTTQAA